MGLVLVVRVVGLTVVVEVEAWAEVMVDVFVMVDVAKYGEFEF